MTYCEFFKFTEWMGLNTKFTNCQLYVNLYLVQPSAFKIHNMKKISSLFLIQMVFKYMLKDH